MEIKDNGMTTSYLPSNKLDLRTLWQIEQTFLEHYQKCHTDEYSDVMQMANAVRSLQCAGIVTASDLAFLRRKDIEVISGIDKAALEQIIILTDFGDIDLEPDKSRPCFIRIRESILYEGCKVENLVATHIDSHIAVIAKVLKPYTDEQYAVRRALPGYILDFNGYPSVKTYSFSQVRKIETH